MRRVSTRRLVKVTASLSAVMPSLVAFARGRPAHLRVGVALAILLIVAGCNPSAAPADPGKAVVSVRFEAGGSHPTRSGISLGERLVVTAAPWTDKKPAFDSIEVLYDEGGPDRSMSGAEISRVEEDWGIVLLRLASSPPAVGSTAQLNKGDKVTLIGREEGAEPAAPSWRSTLGPLREVEGEVTAVATSLPDLRSGSVASGPFLEVRAAGQPGFVGGLVLDSQRRPAALIRLVQVTSSGKAAQSYILPLQALRDWASKQP